MIPVCVPVPTLIAYERFACMFVRIHEASRKTIFHAAKRANNRDQLGSFLLTSDDMYAPVMARLVQGRLYALWVSTVDLRFVRMYVGTYAPHTRKLRIIGKLKMCHEFWPGTLRKRTHTTIYRGTTPQSFV